MEPHEVLNMMIEAQEKGDRERAELAMMLLCLRTGWGPIDKGWEYDLFGNGDLIDDEAKIWLLERALGPDDDGGDGEAAEEPALQAA
jgi:hypothetical protein